MRALLLILMVFSNYALAADISRTLRLLSSSEDPQLLCGELDKTLPNSIKGIRELHKIISEKSTPDTEYCVDAPSPACTVNDVNLQGLELHLLTKIKTQETTVLVATVSSSKWKNLGNIQVGQKVELIENKFGVKIPRTISPIEILGECTPLTVWHKNGIITRLKIDCQACI